MIKDNFDILAVVVMRKAFLFSIFIFSAAILKSQILFEESANYFGVDVSYGLSTLGGGVSFHDFDGDGWDDLTFATGEGSEILFFRNTGTRFVPVDLGIRDTFKNKQVLWVDYDNDGDKDLFATSIIGPNRLYENNGNLIFKDVTEGSGLLLDDLYSYGAAFGDIDNDGDLDLIITHRDVDSKNQWNYLYENRDGVFVDITVSAGLSLENDLSFCASFFDYNKDGFQDIYISNDKYTRSNKLYKNLGNNTFEDVSESSGAGIAIDAMSTTIGDYNADGWLDIYVTNTTGGNQQLRNNGDGTFTNVAEDIGTAMYSIGWGAVFLDAENDGDLDLYVSGMLDGSDSRLPSAFYKNDGGTYTIPSNIGFNGDTRKSFANAIGDVNNDGYPDITVMNDTEDNFLWRNTSTNTGNWIKFILEGTVGHKSGVGSWIEVYSNGKTQYRYTLCGEGYLGQNSAFEFVGLGEATAVDSVKVKWLSGVENVIEDLNANEHYKIVEGSNTAELIEFTYAEEESTSEPTPEDNQEGTANSEDDLGSICPGGKSIIFPNPSRGGSYSICDGAMKSFRLAEIFDFQGRRVATRNLFDGSGNLDLSSLRAGIYIVRFTGAGTEPMMKKVVKL